MTTETKINPFELYFDLKSGMANKANATKRYLSKMTGMYADEIQFEKLVSQEDRLVYEFYELSVPQTSGNLLFGTSIVYPGKVGMEYFMTKGHFHTVLDTAEVYYCLSGQGCMVMETPEGETFVKDFKPGNAVYVPGRHAHRSVNTGTESLVTFFVFRADAGHDYKTIETKGFRKLVVEKDGKPTVIDNPKWS